MTRCECKGAGRIQTWCKDPQCGDSTWDHDVPALVAEVRRLKAGTDALNNHAAALSATLEDLRRAEREIGALLTANGCDCDCEHDAEGHDDDCERCLACRVEAALRGSR